MAALLLPKSQLLKLAELRVHGRQNIVGRLGRMALHDQPMQPRLLLVYAHLRIADELVRVPILRLRQSILRLCHVPSPLLWPPNVHKAYWVP